MTALLRFFSKRRLSLGIAALLPLGLLVPISSPALAAAGSVEVLVEPDNDSPTPPVREFAGATRYETSLAAAQRYVDTARASGSPVSAAIVASGENLIDAAAAAGLARSLNAPVLLTPTSTLFTPAAHLIEREGINQVIIAGGTGAVSAEVEAALRDIWGVQKVERIGGSNRFRTASLIASRFDNIGDYCDSKQRSALLVVGDGNSMADVTTAGPIAYAFGIPILLTSTNDLPAETAAAIRQLEIAQLVLVGGTVPPDQLRSQLAAQGLNTPTVIPIAGANSFATSVAALEALQNCLGDAFDSRSVALISDTALPDGVSAAPVLGKGLRSPGRTTPALLVGSSHLPTEVESYLRRTPRAVQITAIGGTNAISPYVATAAVASANRETIPETAPPFRSGDPQECRLVGLNGQRDPTHGYTYNGTTPGLPLPTWSAPSTGVLKVAVLFVDFPDAAADYSTQEEADIGGLAEFERYFETVSYGKLDVQVDPLHIWLRTPKNTDAYRSGNGGFLNARLVIPEAVELAGPLFDFSPGYDIVLVVHPSRFFGGGTAVPLSGVVADGETLALFSNINSYQFDQGRSGPSSWWGVAAHEVNHNLGLTDLYPADESFDLFPAGRLGRVWLRLHFGLMRFGGLLSVTRSYFDYLVDRNYFDPLSGRTWYRSPEMLAWHRWQLSWLDPERVMCLTEPSFEAGGTLHLVSGNSGVSMLMIPTSETNGIVIEARRNVGYDDNTLPQEGLLIYEVNSQVRYGLLPLRLWHGRSHSNPVQLSEYPVLGVGQTATGTLADGSTLSVSVEADDGQGFSVRITRE